MEGKFALQGVQAPRVLVSPVQLCVSSPTLIHGLQAFAATKSLQSCPTLCDPIDGSPPGSPVPGILQARTLEYGSLMNGLDGYDAETDFW